MGLSESIRHAKKLVTHASCMDGLATAMIIRDCRPDLQIEFVQYGTPEYLGLRPEEGLVFCDMCPAQNDPAQLVEFVAAGAVVLDHHKEARAAVAAFGELGVFADEKTQPGVSGAVLAYLHVWQELEGEDTTRSQLVHEFARLAGVRDTWQQQRVNQRSGEFELNPDWLPALALHAVLESFPATYWLGLPDFEGHGPVVGAGIEAAMEQLMLGRLILEEKARRLNRAFQQGLIIQPALGGRVWALSAQPYELVSDLADLARSHGVNVLVNVHNHIQQGQLRHAVSLRSDGSVDVGSLAKKHGGGGHSRAAGFGEAQILPPADLFRTLILESEASLDATAN